MKRMKRTIPFALLACIALSSFPLGGCNGETAENVLRVASWDEYICEGGEDSYVGADALPLYEEFEIWYEQVYGKKITVEYIPLQDNETMYNKIKMGDSYDLLCPSEYMCMKLAEEGYLQKLPTSFFDKTEENYYATYVSPYIENVFSDEAMDLSDGSSLSEYVAGYMWGSTGFVFNPETVDREDVKSWNVFLSDKYNRRISAKDNVRDSYFAGLGMYYENFLLEEKSKFAQGEITKEEYKHTLFTKMNDTNAMPQVQKLLEKMRGNLYGLETDEGKLDIITGLFDISYQWSGDAVYTLDMGEDEEMRDEPLYLEYCIPESASNLWFDGWVLMNNSKNVDAATAFINFLSMPENVVRNMYYIGYTSCIGGDEVFAYLEETYGAGEEEEETAEYDLSYFFGEGYTLTTYPDQIHRQLFAQYPDTDTIDRLVIMQYFDKQANAQANRMWNTIK